MRARPCLSARTASRAAVLVAAAGLALGPGAQPADAHPFGPPPVAEIAAHGDEVVVDWRSAPDDAIAIGVHVGLLSEHLIAQYLEASTQVAPARRDEERLAASPQLQAYLLRHIVVLQGGRRCDATVTRTEDFVHAGAQVAHRCPEPVGEVELRLSMLHDVHEAYRTFALLDGADVPQRVFTVTSPSQAVVFGAAGGGPAASTSAAWPLAAVAGAAAAVVLVLRRRRA